MKTLLLLVGKTTDAHLQALIGDYCSRIGHYMPFEVEVQPELRTTKGLTFDQQRELEGRELLHRLAPGDHVVLLDERGTERRSVELAQWLEQRQLAAPRRMVFVVGGPYGFSPAVYARANEKISLSKMTFSHQMIRLLFVEQIYRALTILRGQPYHHE